MDVQGELVLFLEADQPVDESAMGADIVRVPKISEVRVVSSDGTDTGWQPTAWDNEEEQELTLTVVLKTYGNAEARAKVRGTVEDVLRTRLHQPDLEVRQS